MKQYILDNGYRKGQPNLTLQKLFSWIKETKDVDICMSTVSIWLHNLGFSYKQFSKGVYFDGHEREDVVESRKLYLELMESFRPRMLVSQSPCCSPECRPIICVFHDESTFTPTAIRLSTGQMAPDKLSNKNHLVKPSWCPIS